MMEHQADIDGILIGAEDKGFGVEYLGEEDMEGTPVHHLKLTIDDSTTVDYYLDAEYFVELKSTVTAQVEDNTYSVDTYYGDYKEVDGLMVAHSTETRVGDQTQMQMVVELVEFNVDAPDSVFAITSSQSSRNDESGLADAGNASDSYAECIRAIVDKHLSSKENQIRRYQYGALPNKEGFGGKVVYKSGSILHIEEKEESSALTLFSQCIADYTDGLDWIFLRNELQNSCKPD
jgi:hypothetical protein